MSDIDILNGAVRVPENVVYRDFSDETVVLNLDTGNYHGLNGTAAAMLQEAVGAATAGAAVTPLATRLGVDAEVISRDIVSLLIQLRDRGLVEITGGGS